MDDLYCLIMSGGQGTRFWPESTRKKPKQYLKLLGNKTLLQQTLTRFSMIPQDQRYVVTVSSQARLVNDQCIGHLDETGIILEPTGRNTGPCILLSLAHLKASGMGGSDVVAVMPADHIILNHQGFQEVLLEAKNLAQKEQSIVTIGVPPTFPHTGYGYIQQGKNIQGSNAYQVQSFKEKPDGETAAKYVSEGNFLWNAGMFVATLDVFLQELEEHASEMFQHFSGLCENIHDPDKIKSLYEKIPKESIDYALMEKTKKILVIPARFDWNDLGSWDALESVLEKKQENTCVNAEDYYFDNAKGNIVYAPGKFVSLINVQDLIVVCNDTSVLILPKTDAQKVKKIVEHLADTPLGDKIL